MYWRGEVINERVGENNQGQRLMLHNSVYEATLLKPKGYTRLAENN
jgi:hypothetical protein